MGFQFNYMKLVGILPKEPPTDWLVVWMMSWDPRIPKPSVSPCVIDQHVQHHTNKQKCNDVILIHRLSAIFDGYQFTGRWNVTETHSSLTNAKYTSNLMFGILNLIFGSQNSLFYDETRYYFSSIRMLDCCCKTLKSHHAQSMMALMTFTEYF